MRKVTAVVSWREKDQQWRVELPDVPAFAAVAQTREEAERHTSDWLASEAGERWYGEAVEPEFVDVAKLDS